MGLIKNSNIPIWHTNTGQFGTPVSWHHSTGTILIDLLCITDRRWFAHFLVRKNFKKEWNVSIVFPRQSPLEHIIDILGSLSKAETWDLKVHSDAGAPGRMLALARGAVGKTSISGSYDICCRGFNSRLFSSYSCFLFHLEFTRNDWIAFRCSRPRGSRLEKRPTEKTERTATTYFDNFERKIASAICIGN